MHEVTVEVPASTSNCGPGFDTLGIALSLANTLTLRRLDDSRIVPAAGAACPARPMVEETAARFFRATGRPAVGFVYEVTGEVPISRGLGSSVTVRAGVAAGLDALLGTDLGPRGLAGFVSKLEGHPDNATAAVLGGFCIGRADPVDGRLLDVVRFPVPDDLIFVVASPGLEISTRESRGALPQRVAFTDAVRTLNSAAFLVAAFAAGEFERLRGTVEDFLHEPYRLPGIPRGREAIVAGVQAGALTGWLSGSGSSVLCVAKPETAGAVGAAMEAAFAAGKVPCKVRLLRSDNDGLRLKRA
jgi:homoserine kinase